jgi:hypothetical protein
MALYSSHSTLFELLVRLEDIIKLSTVLVFARNVELACRNLCIRNLLI